MKVRIDHIEVEKSTKDKLKKLAKEHQPKTSLRAYVAHILEQHTKK